METDEDAEGTDMAESLTGATGATGAVSTPADAYADPVDVQRRDGDPAAFLWRGRVFLVQGVRAHWVETGPWWRSASVRALLAGGPARTGRDRDRSSAARGRTDRASEPVGVAPGRQAAGAAAGMDAAAPALDAGEREFWQVEAAAGRQDVPGVYELCHDWTAGAAGGWSLTRTAG